MNVLWKGRPAQVWEISKTNNQPIWIKQAFAKNYLYWSNNRLRVLMSTLNPSTIENIKMRIVGTIGRGFSGYAMYIMIDISDFLDITHHKVVSKKSLIGNIKYGKANSMF